MCSENTIRLKYQKKKKQENPQEISNEIQHQRNRKHCKTRLDKLNKNI